MQVSVLNLDGSILSQRRLLNRYQPALIDVSGWGPDIRLCCRFGRFREFEAMLTRLLGRASDGPSVTLYGSGDFHHVSLALLRRLPSPVNLLVLDNHPDWMRGVPFLHCGTWVYHAARLPQIERVFHVGGDVDFDNYYRGLAPWRMLRSGKIVVLPGRRRFERGPWTTIANEPVRPEQGIPVDAARLRQFLRPYLADLAHRSLYVSVDKDVMRAADAAINWESGHLTLADVQTVLTIFLELANSRLAGMDILGDWSPVHLRGGMRKLMHLVMHPAIDVNPEQANALNQRTNLALLDTVMAAGAGRVTAASA
jgi:hypothetical protein